MRSNTPLTIGPWLAERAWRWPGGVAGVGRSFCLWQPWDGPWPGPLCRSHTLSAPCASGRWVRCTVLVQGPAARYRTWSPPDSIVTRIALVDPGRSDSTMSLSLQWGSPDPLLASWRRLPVVCWAVVDAAGGTGVSAPPGMPPGAVRCSAKARPERPYACATVPGARVLVQHHAHPVPSPCWSTRSASAARRRTMARARPDRGATSRTRRRARPRGCRTQRCRNGS